MTKIASVMLTSFVVHAFVVGEGKQEPFKLTDLKRKLTSEHNRDFGKDSLLLYKIPSTDIVKFNNMLADIVKYVGSSDKARKGALDYMIREWKNMMAGINTVFGYLGGKVVYCGQAASNSKVRTKVRDEALEWVKYDNNGRVVYYVDTRKVDLAKVKKAFAMGAAQFRDQKAKLAAIITQAEKAQKKCYGDDCYWRWEIVRILAIFLDSTFDKLAASVTSPHPLNASAVNGREKASPLWSLDEYMRQPEVTCNS